MIWALLFIVITSGMVVAHSAFVSSRRNERDARYSRKTMADTFARSGMQDAVAWFHRRSNQPITAFDPVCEPEGRPPRIETIDPDVGLVREFEINGSLWGRYEVRHEDAQDVSSQRGDLAPGSVWELGVRAFVFRRRDPEKSYDESPNQLVGTKAMKSEIRWLQINPPAPAAVCVDDPTQLDIGFGVTVDGGSSVAVAYGDPDDSTGSGEPSISDDSTLTGFPSQLAVPVFDAEAGEVFGMRLDELRSYADALVTEEAQNSGWGWGQLKQTLGEEVVDALEAKSNAKFATADGLEVLLQGKLIYCESMKLAGQLGMNDCLLIVDGDLVGAEGHQTVINGVVYVTGEIRFDRGTLDLRGALIGRGVTKLGSGEADDTASVSVQYDERVIENVRRIVGKYRKRRGVEPDDAR